MRPQNRPTSRRDRLVSEAAIQRRREESIQRQEEVAEFQARVSGLPPEWQRWVKNGRPEKSWISSNVKKLVVQAKLRINMIEQMDRDIDKAKKSLAVLERAILTRNFAAMIVEMEDPGYRSNLATFTIDDVAVQTMTLLHYYKELIASLEMDIELTKGL